MLRLICDEPAYVINENEEYNYTCFLSKSYKAESGANNGNASHTLIRGYSVCDREQTALLRIFKFENLLPETKSRLLSLICSNKRIFGFRKKSGYLVSYVLIRESSA